MRRFAVLTCIFALCACTTPGETPSTTEGSKPVASVAVESSKPAQPAHGSAAPSTAANAGKAESVAPSVAAGPVPVVPPPVIDRKPIPEASSAQAPAAQPPAEKPAPAGVDEAGESAGEASSAQWTQAELESVSATIGTQVEELRGWKFKEPVAVKVTDAEGFFRYAKEREEKTVPDEMKVRDETVAKLLGMLRPDYDLEVELMKILKEQVGGFYDPTTKTFFLMAQFTGGVAKIILAHELTHALDDQYFDLDTGIKTAAGLGTDQGYAYAAVVEGSGTQAMQTWAMKNLKDIDPKDLEKAGSMGADELSTAPPYLWKPLMASYLQGQTFLGSAKGKKPDAVKRAFETPPRSTEQVLHPEKYWKEDKLDEPVSVVFPVLGQGDWNVLGQDTLGEMMLAIASTPLDKRKGLDVKNAFSLLAIKYTNDAAKGWGGDRLVLLARGEDRRLQLVSVWDTEADAKEFADAMNAVLPSVVALEPARGAEAWRPSVTPTGFRVFTGVGTGEFAPRTVVVSITSSSAASALEQSQWLEESALLPWVAELPEAR